MRSSAYRGEKRRGWISRVGTLPHVTSAVVIDGAAAQTIGAALDEARQGRGLSGRQLARSAGLTEGRWRQIARGDRPPLATAARLAQAVGLDPLELLTEHGYDVTADVLTDLLAPPDQPPDDAALRDRIRRIRRLRVDSATRLQLLDALIEAVEQRQTEG